MKASSSRWAFCLGFLVGAFSGYFFLFQAWFERSYPVLSEAQERGSMVAEESPTNWRKEGPALFNLLHPHHPGLSFNHNKFCKKIPPSLVYTAFLALSH